jgi:hypothetical protein
MFKHPWALTYLGLYDIHVRVVESQSVVYSVWAVSLLLTV